MSVAPDPSTESAPTRSAGCLIWLVLIAIVSIGGSIWLRTRLAPHETDNGISHPAVGTTWVPPALTRLTGEDGELTAESLRGKIVLINYWGTWCAPCLMEFPHLVEMTRRLSSDANFRFVSVSCQDPLPRAELRERTRKYLTDHGYDDLPVYCDLSMEHRRSLAQAAGLGDVFGYPTTVVLDHRFVIRGLWVGVSERHIEATVREQEQLVRKLLREARR